MLTRSTLEDVLCAAAAARDQAPAPDDERYGAYCSELARCLAERWDCVRDANARDVARDRKSTRLNSSHTMQSRMPSSA